MFRVDVIADVAKHESAVLHFDVADDARLAVQLATLRRWRSTTSGTCHAQLANRVLALQAVDARNAGASLRDAADLIVGPGPWPGDAEHRKSLVRRLIATGAAMIEAGPRPILAG